jgi:hypothetical protein
MSVHLLQPMTLVEYEREFGFDRLDGWRQHRWADQRAEIEAELAAGGELWEWAYRSNFGITNITGLAVVRGGLVARKWRFWG